MALGWFARFLLLAGVVVLLTSLLLKTPAWPIGGLLLVIATFMWAIAYALRLPQ
jgi:hypothetical protein